MSEKFTLEQLQGIIRGGKQYELVPFPHVGMKDKYIAIKVLTQYERELAVRAAEIRFMKDPEYKDSDFRTTVAFNIEMERQFLYYTVCQEPSDIEQPLERFFTDTASIGLLPQETVDALHSKFSTVQEKYNPQTKVRTEAELDLLIEEVKKNSAIGLYLNSLELVALIDFLVKNPETLLKGNGSLPTSTQPDKTNSKQKQPSVAEVDKIEVIS